MHELGITCNIVAIVSEAAQGRKVARVTLEVGKLAGVMSGAIACCFEAVSQGSALEGATLEIRQIPGRAECNDCGVVFEAATLFAACPCGSRQITWRQGQELNIKSMELREIV